MTYAFDPTDTQGHHFEDADGNPLRFGLQHRWQLCVTWEPEGAPTTSPWPLVIYVHGGGVTKPIGVSPTAGYRHLGPKGTLNRMTGALGCAVASIEFMPGSFNIPRTQVYPYGFADEQVEDLRKAIRFFRDHPDDADLWGGGTIDPDRIVIFGESQGAILALLSQLGPDLDPRNETDFGRGSSYYGRFAEASHSRVSSVIALSAFWDFTQAGAQVSPGSWLNMRGNGRLDVEVAQQDRVHISPWWCLAASSRRGGTQGIASRAGDLNLLNLYPYVPDSGWTWKPLELDDAISDPHEPWPQAWEVHRELIAQGYAPRGPGGRTQTWVDTGQGGPNPLPALGQGMEELGSSSVTQVVEDWLRDHVLVESRSRPGSRASDAQGSK